MPVALVPNLARAIAELKEHYCTTLGLDGDAEQLIEDEPFTGRVAFVLGAEGKGLRELSRNSCDRLVRIATSGPDRQPQRLECGGHQPASRRLETTLTQKTKRRQDCPIALRRLQSLFGQSQISGLRQT